MFSTDMTSNDPAENINFIVYRMLKSTNLHGVEELSSWELISRPDGKDGVGLKSLNLVVNNLFAKELGTSCIVVVDIRHGVNQKLPV